MAKYPPNSYPIDHKKTGDILQAKYQTQTEKLWSDESPKYQLQIWSPKYYYDETDKSIVLNYSVTTPSRLEITLEKKKINKAIKGSGLIRIPLNDLEFGDHLLKISSFGSQQKEVIHTTRVITYQERMYQYNGITQDKVSNQGDLNFTVDFDIYHKGHYLLEATLYNENDEIIALSEKTYLLDTGEQQIDLSFYGKILFQQKSEGRYKIKFMTLTKVDENLNLKRSSLIRADYTSKHYLYDQFHDNDFNDEVQLAKAMQIP